MFHPSGMRPLRGCTQVDVPERVHLNEVHLRSRIPSDQKQKTAHYDAIYQAGCRYCAYLSLLLAVVWLMQSSFIVVFVMLLQIVMLFAFQATFW